MCFGLSSVRRPELGIKSQAFILGLQKSVSPVFLALLFCSLAVLCVVAHYTLSYMWSSSAFVHPHVLPDVNFNRNMHWAN